MSDQQEKLELHISGAEYYLTDSSLVFGENIDVSGGVAPFRYTWYGNGTVEGNGQSIEIPYPPKSEIYTLIISDANNCTASLEITHGITVSSDLVEKEDRQIKVFPVPAARQITIDPGEIQQTLTVTFYNYTGSVVLSKRFSGITSIDFNLPAGIYHIRIEYQSGQPVSLHKIIVL